MIKPKDILAYFQGKIRYRVFYSQYFTWLIRRHILEQIEMRISSMDRSCYTSGACMLCGCTTTALQMADKPCDKPCYPPMMNRKQWEFFKKDTSFKVGKSTIWVYNKGKLLLRSI